jgi:hypothetical protein
MENIVVAVVFATAAFARLPSTAKATWSTPIASGCANELFRGRLSDEQFHGSEACLTHFIKARANTKPHLAGLRLFHWPPWSR